MEYKGKLYGKVGKSYFALIENTDDVNNLNNQNKEMLDMLVKISDMCNTLNLTIIRDEIDQLIQKYTEI